MACKLNLRNIEFKGTQPSEPYYAESSVLCMTSTYEGFPMVLIEAQQYGCVPMAFDSFEAVHDIIEDGENGDTKLHLTLKSMPINYTIYAKIKQGVSKWQ